MQTIAHAEIIVPSKLQAIREFSLFFSAVCTASAVAGYFFAYYI